MKKLTALFLTLALSLSLTACGAKQDSPAQSAPAASAPASSAPAASVRRERTTETSNVRPSTVRFA